MRCCLTLAGFLFIAPLLHAQGIKTPAAFRVADPIVSQFEDGPPLAGGQKLVAGETLFFRFGVVNFKTSAKGAVEVTGHAQAFDPRGTAIVAEDQVAIGTTLSQEDKDWKPVLRWQFQVPAIAPPGTYHIKFEAIDAQTHQTAAGESTFAVDGRDVRPSPTLAIRELGFYRGPDEETPLKVAAYRAGDMVWVRFDVTGYKYGEQNAIDVAYDVAVVDSAGKQLFAQENAAVERSQAFYPQPWVPGIFSLTLQGDMNKGGYAVTITARDGFGNQTVTQKAPFKVE